MTCLVILFFIFLVCECFLSLLVWMTNIIRLGNLLESTYVWCLPLWYASNYVYACLHLTLPMYLRCQKGEYVYGSVV